jgi:magnesium chelatase family protein
LLSVEHRRRALAACGASVALALATARDARARVSARAVKSGAGMTSIVQTGSLSGVRAYGVRVEASPIRGLPGFDIVGLPEAGIRESRVRVLAALRNSGFELPEQRFVVNLAPADVRKSGSSFDLAIAVALLAQCGLCAPIKLADTLIVGELSLDGVLRPVRGLLAQLLSARERGLLHALIPHAGASGAGLVPGLQLNCAEHLLDAVAFLGGERALSGPPPRGELPRTTQSALDLRDVRGQHAAKRALEVAAAGGHDVLMIGPPGSGKSMLAQRLPGLLPPPTPDEAIEIATIAGAGGLVPHALDLRVTERPFRAPHHSCSDVALIGGGEPIRPGEVTLAHGGVLFLDELPEFRRAALEALRPTMESGFAMIVRARDRACMPAKPLIVAAMNPCPCGYAGHPRRICRCGGDQVQRYRARVSGPLLDRFDIHVALPPVSVREIERGAPGEHTKTVRKRVTAARAYAQARIAAQLAVPTEPRPPLLQMSAELEPRALALLQRCMHELELSLRAYAKVLKIARTIADLEQCERVGVPHVAEAVQYRVLDREPRRPELAPGERRDLTNS